ncbi:MAG: glycosyltransferase [Chloroflexota bacterium]|nr:glycosyltransferase [Chloroflexota bacterium]
MGFLVERKGHAYVLKALRRLLDLDAGYDLRYVIVGNGPEEENLRALVEVLDLTEIVSFEGYKAHDEVWRYFAACDIFVLPSWDEAFGVVYVEALSQAKPVIGCEGAGGPEDLKALADCVELVKPRDVGSLVHALQRLLDDPARRQQMGKVGQKVVEEYFTWERNAADTMAIYREVVAARKSLAA